MADNTTGIKLGAILVPSAPGVPTGNADELKGGVHQANEDGRLAITGDRRTRGLIVIEPNGSWILDGNSENSSWKPLLQWQYQDIPEFQPDTEDAHTLVVTLSNGELRKITLSQLSSLVGGTSGGEIPDGHTNLVAIIHDISTVAPDILCITVRDPPYILNGIIEIPPSELNRGDYINYNGQHGFLIGRNKDHIRLFDTHPSERLDRTLLDRASGYKGLNGRTVTQASYKAYPYNSFGQHRREYNSPWTYSSFEYRIYLRLSSPLTTGTYNMTWPGAMLPPIQFTFNDKITRCDAIHTNQHGHAPTDVSKVAFLSLWLPENYNGKVDFISAYGIEEFHLIDSLGNIVYTGDVTLRKSVTDLELGLNVSGNSLMSYGQMGALGYRVTEGISATSLRVPNNTFTPGQRVIFKSMYWSEEVVFGSATVVSNNGGVLELSNIDGAWPIDTLNSQARIWAAVQGNAALTDVFEMDYSDFVPNTNTSYRLYIPGMGVSDSISFTSNNWDRLNEIVTESLYNQRAGCALDGRFGYTRPVAIKTGEDITLYQSRVPVIFSYNGFIANSAIPMEQMLDSPWGTGNSVPNSWFGSHMDAGDWDAIGHQHIEGYSTTLCSLLLWLSKDKPKHNYGISKSSELLGELFEGTDDLDDVIHEMIWALEFYRRAQREDGAIRGGFEFTGGPARGTPSYLTELDCYVYSPDHITSYRYAHAAAILSEVIRKQGHSDLADVYLESAERAWAAGEAGRANPDLFYADFVTAANSSTIFNNKPWISYKSDLDVENPLSRFSAAGALYYVTEDIAYKNVCEAFSGNVADNNPSVTLGAWYYCQTDGADSTRKTNWETAIVNYVNNTVLPTDCSYPIIKDVRTPGIWGMISLPTRGASIALIIASEITNNDIYVKRMQDCLSHYLGANQLGKALVTGIGYRTATAPLHEDSFAMGVAPPRGIPIYGYHNRHDYALAQTWLFSYNWAAMPEFGELYEESDKRMLHPTRLQIPQWEMLYQYPYIVPQQEYTVHQSHAVLMAISLYLDYVTPTDLLDYVLKTDAIVWDFRKHAIQTISSDGIRVEEDNWPSGIDVNTWEEGVGLNFPTNGHVALVRDNPRTVPVYFGIRFFLSTDALVGEGFKSIFRMEGSFHHLILGISRLDGNVEIGFERWGVEDPFNTVFRSSSGFIQGGWHSLEMLIVNERVEISVNGVQAVNEACPFNQESFLTQGHLNVYLPGSFAMSNQGHKIISKCIMKYTPISSDERNLYRDWLSE